MSNTPLNATQLDRLQVINSELNAYTSLDDVCWAIAAAVEELAELEDCVVYVRLGNVLTQTAAIGPKTGAEGVILNRIGLPIGVGIVGSVARTGVEEYVADVRRDGRYVADDYPGRSEFATPIVHRGEVIGVLDSEHNEVDGINLTQRQMMTSIAVLSAPHVAALIAREGSADQDYAEVIADLAHMQLSVPGNLQRVFTNLTERAAKTLRSARANIWLLDEAGTRIDCVDHYDLRSNEHSSGASLAREQAPAYFRQLETERTIMVNDARGDERTSELGDYLQANDVHSLLDAPILVGGKPAGVICIEHTGNTRDWRSEEASFVGTLSDLATIALLSEQKAEAERALVQSQKMESLGRLAGGLAHDFNNLLTVIGGAVETLQITSRSQGKEASLHRLIADAADRARKLTRNLMTFGGKQRLALEHIRVADLAESIEQLTTSLIREDTKLTITLAEEPIWVEGDPGLMEQMLLNLIINSVDAMPEGGDIHLSFGLDEAGSVRIQVEDNGAGMDETLQQKIFDPFFTTKGDFGSGLGLSICQGIVTQHGGTLTCRSKPGVGSVFEISMPAARPGVDAAEKKASVPVSLKAPANTRILLVEDEAGVRDVVGRMLSVLGYETVVAQSAEHAIDMLAEKPVDILVSDVVMPDMRGPDLFRAARLIQPSLSALFVSGYTDQIIRESSFGDARVAYMSKPFTMDELGRALAQLAGVGESRPTR